MTVYKGCILTCDEKETCYRYLVEEEGTIRYTGNELPEAFGSHPLKDLGAKALAPAFGDTHLHFSSHALFSSTLDVRDAKNISHLSELIRNYVGQNRPRIILGFGISAHSMAESCLVTRRDLDPMADLPMMLIKYDGHAAVINSAMARLLPKKIKTLRGFQEETGHLFQEAFFAAADHITAKVSVPALVRSMLLACDRLAEKGIGLLHPAEGVGFLLDLDVDMVRLLARGLANPLQFRVFFQTLETRKVIRRKLPRIGGCFATALDGCFGSTDAALNQPYAHDPTNRGILFYPDREISGFIQKAHDQGLQIQVHAIGDAAVDQAVQAFAQAQKNNFRKDHRHSIIHACLMGKEAMAGCAEYGIGIAAQPAFLHWDLEPYAYLKTILGDRVDRISPLKTMLDMGIRVSGGSDAPCTLPDPVFGMWCACNHYIESESLSVAQALRMFTHEAAWASFDEKERGSLEPGKRADMVILNQNPLAMDPRNLRQLCTEQLILGGKPYTPGQGLGSLVLNNLLGRKPA